MNQENKIVWVVDGDKEMDFKETTFKGVLADAINYVVDLAKQAGFVLGQILAFDGKVIATIGPNGAVKYA